MRDVLYSVGRKRAWVRTEQVDWDWNTSVSHKTMFLHTSNKSPGKQVCWFDALGRHSSQEAGKHVLGNGICCRWCSRDLNQGRRCLMSFHDLHHTNLLLQLRAARLRGSCGR